LSRSSSYRFQNFDQLAFLVENLEWIWLHPQPGAAAALQVGLRVDAGRAPTVTPGSA
jgi:hypothetical protein